MSVRGGYRADVAFDGDRPLPGGALVLVEEGVITGVEPGPAPAPDGWEVTYLPGTALLPGLIDAHTHLCGNSEPDALDRLGGLSAEELDAAVETAFAAQFAHGVTAVRDLGDRDWAVVDRHRHRPDGPTVVAAGPPITSVGGHCAVMGGEASGVDGLRQAVRERADGEAFDSWLRRLAHRNGLPLLRLAPALGLGDRLHVWRNYALTWHLPADLLRRVETQAGLGPASLNAAVLDQFDPLGWKPIPGCRYCPACLTESGGQWKIRWQLPHVFACTIHRCVLASVCPVCGRTPHSRLSEHCGTASLTACTIGTSRHGKSCTGDLLTHQPQYLPADDPRLAAQRWIDHRLDRMNTGDNTGDHTAAVVDLRDLDALTVWLRQRLHSAELAHFGPDTVTAIEQFRQRRNVYKRHQPAAALLAAALASHAIAVITSADGGRDEKAAAASRRCCAMSTPSTAPDSDHRPAAR